ncbi:alpha/beta fold hydrolase [Streptomyces halobius]|uniref:Alpha/beta hydrolase n=1 Tax=Streptomyces halobius TaxID=2879846 RepID=A0ABY4MC50_9ACTN|nr:alpha/beta hydrolase [Streptomyces halobius]UQA95013.1 alpha/beta hydrolase [Streptomyces halobius]
MTDEAAEVVEGVEVVNGLSVDGLSYSYRLLRQPSPRTEPVLVLGGALQDKHGWEHFDEPVLPVASLITIDLPGSGNSDPLRPDQGLDTMCQAVEQVIDDLGIARVNLFGYSFGSVIGFAFAQQRPDRIARLLLGGVPAYVSHTQQDLWRQAAARMKAGEPEEFVNRALKLWLCQDERRYVRHRKLAHRYVKRLITHALTHIPHGFAVLDRAATDRDTEMLNPSGALRGVPTLIFCGEHDTVSAPEHQRAFAATIENSSFLAIAESDHWVAFERSQDVIDLVVRFFTDQSLDTADYVVRPESRLAPVMR